VERATDVPKGELLERLRAQVAAREARGRPSPYPVPAELAGVLDGGLKPGSAYSLDSSGALLAALLAEPSREGHWCGVVGMPEFGAEAAERAGVVLARLALVPDPAAEWLAVTAALVEALPVVAVRPTGRVREADAARLASRLRDRGSVLIVHGQWPRAEALLSIGDPHWSGVGDGYGFLASREVTLTVRSRRVPVPQRIPLVLPAPDGRLAGVVAPASSEPSLGLQAVG
jgi:hypothetical protein